MEGLFSTGLPRLVSYTMYFLTKCPVVGLDGVEVQLDFVMLFVLVHQETLIFFISKAHHTLKGLGNRQNNH